VRVQQLIQRTEAREVILTRAAPSRSTWLRRAGGAPISAGDEVVLTGWSITPKSSLQMGASRRARLRVVPITTPESRARASSALGDRTRFVSIITCRTFWEPSTGGRDDPPGARAGAPVLVDAAHRCRTCPSTSRRSTAISSLLGSQDVRATGIGALYGKAALLEAMPPWQGGGDMIASVSFEKTTYNTCPTSSRPGRPTLRRRASAPPSTTSAIRPRRGGAPERTGRLRRARLRDLRGIRIIGSPGERAGVCRSSWTACTHTTSDHPRSRGVAIRPASTARTDHGPLRHPRTARVSFAIYNTRRGRRVHPRTPHRARTVGVRS